MEGLKQIANIAGHPGLFRILKPSRAGVIVETLDDRKTKTMMGPTARVSVLSDISIYVDTAEGSVPLAEVLRAVNERYGDTLLADPKSSPDELSEFIATVVPDYDRERVRTGDIRKLIVWYGILREYAPELFDEPAPAEADTPASAEESPTTGEAATSDADTSATVTGESAPQVTPEQA